MIYSKQLSLTDFKNTNPFVPGNFEWVTVDFYYDGPLSGWVKSGDLKYYALTIDLDLTTRIETWGLFEPLGVALKHEQRFLSWHKILVEPFSDPNSLPRRYYNGLYRNYIDYDLSDSNVARAIGWTEKINGGYDY
jgi:hypothetical protein